MLTRRRGCGIIPVSYTHLERHDEELTGSEPAQQTSGEDYSGDWGERHDEELTAQQTSGEPDAVPQAVPYTCLLYTSRCV